MGSKKQTIGYWYELAWHDGLCTGPLDAYLEMRGGTKPAWTGRLTSSATVSINEENLWGGEKDQGGIVGSMAVMFGEATQTPNAYLVSTFGPQTVAWRGVATVAFEGGKWGANNPYAQKRSHKVERIKKGWDGDACWYEAKAVVPLAAAETTTLVSADATLDANTSSPDGTGVGIDFTVPAGAVISVKLGPSSDSWSYTPSDDYNLSEFPRTWSNRFGLRNLDTGAVSTYWLDIYLTPAEGRAAHGSSEILAPAVTGGNYRLFLYDATVDDNRGIGSYSVAYMGSTLNAKNPAHMLVFAHTQDDCGGQDISTVNTASAEAAADWFYANGFGLCTKRLPDQESPREFQGRVERVSGCSMTQNLADGLYYIDIANGEYDLGSLPILTDDDIVSFDETPTVLNDAINSVSIRYFDPQRKEPIVTPPLRAMGLVAEFGTIHQTFEFQEIPTDALANRVAHRELLARCTPTRVFDLATTRVTSGWRRNTYFRLQAPKRGIFDMVCLLSEIETGSLKSGAVKIKAQQDIYSLPITAYTSTEMGVDTRPSKTPTAATVQRVFEAPYIDVAASLTSTERDALSPDTGFAIAVAGTPENAIDFVIAADAGAGYADVEDGEFCTVLTVTSSTGGGVKTGIPVTGEGLADITIGTHCLWDDELCRVDAVGSGTIDLGRGVGDTIPVTHTSGSLIMVYADAAAPDPTEYTDGETVSFKVLPRNGSNRLPLASATALPLTFDARIARPYPPANVKVGGVSIFTVDPFGGDGSIEPPVTVTMGGTIPPLNGDFEAGTTGWDLGAGFAIVNDPAAAETGSWLLRWTGGIASQAVNQQIVTIQSPGTFLAPLRVRIRMAVPTTSAPRPKAQVYITKYNIAGDQVAQVQSNIVLLLPGQTDTGWRDIDGFCDRTGDQAYLKVSVLADGGADCTIEFENLTWNGLEYIP